MTPHAQMQDFFFFLPVAALPQGGLSVTVAHMLGSRGASVQGHGLPQLHELWPYQSFFELLVAGDQKASLASLSL